MNDIDYKKCNDQIPLEDYPLAMAYVPRQIWRNICNLDDGFHNGTIFKDLQKPFLCYKSRGEI